MRNLSKRSAFTMIEIIFVIVVLGIVSSIGAEIIAKVYRSYILERAVYRANMKTELAALQIANRLSGRIKGTIYRIKSDGSREVFTSSTSGSDYVGLQWVAKDIDSFNEGGWSGFCDVDPSSKSSLKSPGSTFSTTNTIIDNLSDKTLNDAVVYFPDNYDINGILLPYGVNQNDDTTLDFDDTNDKNLTERYHLSWTSYALVVESGNLYLYYDFSPLPGSDYSQGKRKLLLANVSKFKFPARAQHSIRFKICVKENIGDTDFNVTACKEKVGF